VPHFIEAEDVPKKTVFGSAIFDQEAGVNHVLREAGSGHAEAELLAGNRVGEVLDESDAVSSRVVDLEPEVAVPAFSHIGRNTDAFCGEVVAHGFGVGSFESYFDEAVFVFRLQSFVDFEVLVVVDFEPGGGTEALGHG